MLKRMILFGSILLALGAAAPSEAAVDFYVRIKAQMQGEIKGSVVQKGREGLIRGIAFQHEIVSPRDVASGQATGKRQHKPIRIVCEMDRAYPLLFNAVAINEGLPQVELIFWKPQRLGSAGGTGQEIQYMKITLTNASISRVAASLQNTRDLNLARLPETYEVDFTYQKIEIENIEGQTKGSDSLVESLKERRTQSARKIARNPRPSQRSTSGNAIR